MNDPPALLDRPRLRSLLGASAALWAGEDGVTVREDRWSAFSGAAAVDYNVVLCHGPDSVESGREELLANGVPGLLMLAGEALGEAQRLIEASWVCVDSVPMMWRPVGVADPGTVPAGPAPPGERRRLRSRADLDAARTLLTTVFGLPPELGEVAIPDTVLDSPTHMAWGAFDERGEVVSCVGGVRVEEAVGGWSLATSPAARGQGHGAHLMAKMGLDVDAEGAEIMLFHAAPAAAAYYRRRGRRDIENWQVWSRPRWVLGRA